MTPAAISGTTTGTVTEDGTLIVPVTTLTVTDPDAGEAVFEPASPASLIGAYGSFTFNAATGAWGYTLNNSALAVQALTAGDLKHDTLVVRSLDGSAVTLLDVAVNGVFDAPPTALNLTGASPGGGITVSEHTAGPAGTLSTVDADSTAFTYSITGGSGAGKFLIGGVNHDQIVVANTATLDLERDGTTPYTLVVKSTDQSGQSIARTFSVTVNDLIPDDVTGTPANDTLVGGATINHIHGGDGRDRLTGGSLSDFLFGDADNDTMFGNDGADDLTGGDGNDRLFGGAAADKLNGSLGNDILTGGDGDDTLTGGLNGIDRLLGGAGDDRLEGGERSTGGAGADTFVFTPRDVQIVTDFSHADGDVIDMVQLGSSIDTLAEVLASSLNSFRGTYIFAPTGGFLVLLGVHKADLVAADFHFA
jgi:large repetitive protein